MMKENEEDAPVLSASEALYGFASWLTTRQSVVTLSARHEAGIVAELVDEFCKANNLNEPRKHWTDWLISPAKKTTSITKEEYDRLVKAEKLLQALQAAGVDSWDGYEFACESMNQVVKRFTSD